MALKRGRTCFATAPLLFGIGMSTPSLAQTALQPPEFEQVDANGVDLLSGSASFSVDLGSVGSGIGALGFRNFWFGNTDSNSLNNTLALTVYEGPKGGQEKWSATVSFDGSSNTFNEIDPAGSENWALARSIGPKLTASGANRVLTMPDGETRTYGIPSGNNSFQMLLSRVQPNGVTWIYQWEEGQYLGQGRATSVTNNLGYRIALEYLSNTSSAMSDWAFVKTVRFYNLAVSGTVPVATATRTRTGTSVDIVTSGGQVWRVLGQTSPSNTDVYVSSVPFQVKTPSSSAVNRAYTAITLKIAALPTYNQHFTTSATINGMTYGYDFVMASVNGSNIGTTRVTDPLGKTREVQYTDYTAPLAKAAFPLRVTDETGNVTQYAANGYIVTSVTRPEGDQDVLSYDARGNLTGITHKAKPGSGLPDMVESASYPATCTNTIICNRPTSVTDRKGLTTDYTYDPQHGGVLTESLPATPAGVRPVKRHSYVQRSAWISNSAGGYVQSTPPVWLKSEERTCRTTATVGNACAGGSTDEVVTTFDYGPNSGPNNLLLRGMTVVADGQTLRTCYTYDASGNRLTETQPLGTGGTCP